MMFWVLTSLIIATILSGYFYRSQIKYWAYRKLIMYVLSDPSTIQSIIMSILNNPSTIHVLSSIINSGSDMSDTPTKSISSAILVNPKSLKVDFEHNGERYEIYLPYNRRKSRSTRYVLIDHDDQEVEIDHHPWVDFKSTAKDLGVKSIRVVNTDKNHLSTHHEDEPVESP